jgi:hypothetical protein
VAVVQRQQGAAGVDLARLALGLCVLGAGLHAAWFHGLRHDDAYVTFRYARNLAEGQGFVFNPGQRVLGTTAPLFALLLAPLYALFGDAVASCAVAISACAVGMQAWLLQALVRPQLPRTATVLAGAVALGLADSVSWLALETHLAYTLGLASVYCAARARPVWAGVLLGLAFVARHDMLLWGPWVLWLLRPGTRLAAAPRVLAPAAAIALAWLAFALIYFGQPLPQTLGAKFQTSSALGYVTHYGELFSRVPGIVGLPAPLRWACAGLAFASGARLALGPVPALRPVLGFALSLLLAYVVLRPPASQHWHLYGATLGLRVAMVAGLCGVLELRRTGQPRGARLALGLGAALCATLGVGLWQRSDSFARERWLGERHRRYEQVARYVNDHVPPGGRFMATEIGTLGYLTDRLMVDPFGLVNATNAWPRSMRPEDYMDLVRHYRPELLLLDSPEAARSLAQYAPELRYRVLKVFEWQFPFSTLAVRE